MDNIACKCFLMLGLYQITAVLSAPLILLPQSMLLAQKILLQEQIQALQPSSFDGLSRSPLKLNTPLLIPYSSIPNTNIAFQMKKENDLQSDVSIKDNNESNLEDNGDEDSIVIDAKQDQKDILQQKVVPMVPGEQRFAVGSIIAAIPFFPIEVNVPDSIAWAWNGISGIISGLGQRLPLRPRPETPRPFDDVFLKMLRQQHVSNTYPTPLIKLNMDDVVANMQQYNILSNSLLMPNMGMPLIIMPYPYHSAEDFGTNHES